MKGLANERVQRFENCSLFELGVWCNFCIEAGGEGEGDSLSWHVYSYAKEGNSTFTEGEKSELGNQPVGKYELSH